MASENNDLENKLNRIAEENSSPKVQVIEDEEVVRPVKKKKVQTNVSVKQAEPVQPVKMYEPEDEEEYEDGEEIDDANYDDEEEEIEVEEPITEKKEFAEAETERMLRGEQTEVIRKIPTKEDDMFISDTFNDLMKSVDQQEEIDNGDIDATDILKSINVDLSSIEIMDATDDFQLHTIEDAILDNHSTMLVTCCQSGYTAEMTALKSQEIHSLTNSDVDYYSYKKKLYQLLNKHMAKTSVGRMEYGDWLHYTSYFDIDTLLYGIYCQTFDYENKYTIQCPNCGSRFDAIVNNRTLIEMRGSKEEIYAKINDIISNINKPEDLIKASKVHKIKRISLNESKIVVDIQIPSAYDYLEEVVAKNDDRDLEEYETAIGLSLFIKDIYLPNILLYKESGKLKYVKLPEDDSNKKLNAIANLSYYDSLQLSDEINNYVEQYRITYSIKECNCPRCGHQVPKIPVDMEEVLFSTIRRGNSNR